MFGSGKRIVRNVLNKFGHDIVPLAKPAVPTSPDFPPDFDAETIATCRFVKPFTMTSPERIFSL